MLVDLNNPYMQPVRDPLRSLVYTAADRAVRDVFVGGNQVVKNGAVLTMNHAEAVGRLAEAQARMEREVPTRDYRKRQSEQIAPFSLPIVQ